MSHDEQKKNGPGGGGGGGNGRPPGILPPTPEDAREQLSRLRKHFEGAERFAANLERMVGEGGFDIRFRRLLIDAADHFEQLPDMALATARVLRMFALQG